METSTGRLEAISQATLRGRLLISAFRGLTVEPGDQLQALKDASRALSEAHIPHALIGGVAVGLYTIPRATNDIDIAVASTISRNDLAEVLSGAGFESTGQFAHSLNFRHHNGEPLQVSIDPYFDEMIARSMVISEEGLNIPVVIKEDLIEMKERAAADKSRRKSKTLRDQADIELLRGDVPDPDEGW